MKSLFTESARPLPSRAGRSRAGLQLPPWVGQREHKQPRPLCQTPLPHGMGRAWSSSTGMAGELGRSFTPRTLWAHQTHICMITNMEETGRFWGYSHLTTASQVTPARAHRAFPPSHHVPVCTHTQITKKYTAVIKMSSLKRWHVAHTFK